MVNLVPLHNAPGIQQLMNVFKQDMESRYHWATEAGSLSPTRIQKICGQGDAHKFNFILSTDVARAPYQKRSMFLL